MAQSAALDMVATGKCMMQKKKESTEARSVSAVDYYACMA